MREKLLMTPGPTMLPPEVISVLGRQIIHHRTKEFLTTLEKVQEDLKYVFCTKNHVLILTSSGTGGLESAAVNMFSPGEKVLCASVGAFGDRIIDICTKFGLDVLPLRYEWGKAIDVQDIKKILDEDKENKIKGIFCTQNETSTGVTNDIKAVGELTKNTERLLIVDAISSMGGLELLTDEWGVDVVIAGSQKALMIPPGLCYVSVNEKAWKACEKSTFPKFYWDYIKYKKGILGELSENPPYTPALTLICAQSAAIDLIRQEGLENVYARHKMLAKAVQAGAQALGLSLLPDREVSSYIVTAIKAPEGIDIAAVIKKLNLKYDIMVTGGQKALKSKIMRIGHCGYTYGDDVIKTFSALEMALSQEGYKFKSGASLEAIQNILNLKS